MNSFLRLLPKTLFEIAATQHGINEYATLRRYVVAQCTRAKYGQHGLVSLEATVAGANELGRCDDKEILEADDDDGSWPDWRPDEGQQEDYEKALMALKGRFGKGQKDGRRAAAALGQPAGGVARQATKLPTAATSKS